VLEAISMNGLGSEIIELGSREMTFGPRTVNTLTHTL
jgi:hypothetical protein